MERRLSNHGKAMKVLVTGASGLLGRAVLKALIDAGHDAKGTAFSRASGSLIKLDLLDEQAVNDLVTIYAPDVLVHCAAERRPDAAEANPEGTTKLNVGLTSQLASLTHKLPDLKLIYISTDYVFDGASAPSGGYTSRDKTGPTNAYGISKLQGEDAIRSDAADGRAVTLRVPVLYGEVGWNGESAVNILLDAVEKAGKGEAVKMDNWAARYPTNVADVARALVDIAELSASKPFPAILHFSSQQVDPSGTPWTKYTLSQFFASLYSPALATASLVPVNDGPKPGETIRPKDCHLSNEELEAWGVTGSTVDFGTWWKGWFERQKDTKE